MKIDEMVFQKTGATEQKILFYAKDAYYSYDKSFECNGHLLAIKTDCPIDTVIYLGELENQDKLEYKAFTILKDILFGLGICCTLSEVKRLLYISDYEKIKNKIQKAIENKKHFDCIAKEGTKTERKRANRATKLIQNGISEVNQ